MDNITEEHNETINMEYVADSAVDDIKLGVIIKGEIVTIDSEYVYINVGSKSDGSVPKTEFKEDPKIGEFIYVILKNKRLVDGVYQFSKKAADDEISWKTFTDKFNDEDAVVDGRIISAIKKGKIVQLDGITAFLPFSLAADLKRESETEDNCKFKILEIDRKKKSIIVSRKDFLDDEKIKNWESFIEKHNVDDKIEGEILKFVEFGAFVRIDGIDALLHRNDMSWKNIFKQRKIFKLSDKKEFVILSINKEDRKVSLGYKQLTEDPWVNIDEKFQEGKVISGKVVTVTTSGAFIEIGENIEGYVGNSDISWTKNNPNPKNYFEKDADMEFQVLKVSKEERKVFLGLKQRTENPWESIGERFPVDSVYKNKIKKIMNFGMFVELEDGIDGLIHVSDVTWDDKAKDSLSSYKAGNEVEYKILKINAAEMKISCGIKQLQKSPWEIIAKNYPPRKRVAGVISGVTDFGLFIKIEDNVEGLVHISEVSKERVENLKDVFKEGTDVEAIVLNVDVKKKRLSLSIKKFDSISEKEELAKILKNTGSSKATLGDFVKIKLGE